MEKAPSSLFGGNKKFKKKECLPPSVIPRKRYLIYGITT
jgi:hypothetical protein